MQKLPRISGKELIKILSKQGFQTVRQKGSHVILIKETAERKICTVVPLHDEIDRGTILEILRQTGITKEQFLSLL